MVRWNTSTACILILVLVALVSACSDDGGPTSPTIAPQSGAAGTIAPQHQLANPGAARSERVFNCSELAEANVRFSHPGFIRGNRVGLFVLYEGLPAGEKKLTIWWDEENRPTQFETINLGDGEPANEERTLFNIREILEHTYRDVVDEEKRRVRVQLNVEGTIDNCPRVRHIKVGGAVDQASGGCSGAPLSGTVWYVDASAAGGGTGGINDPFDNMNAAESASAPGDTIYVFQGNYPLPNRFDLQAGQKLIGSGVSACVGAKSLPATSAPVISRPNGQIIRTFGDGQIRGINTSGGNHSIVVNAPGNVTLQDLGLSGYNSSGVRVRAGNVTARRLTMTGGTWGTNQDVNDANSSLDLRNSTVTATRGHRVRRGNSLALNQVTINASNDDGVRAQNGAVTVSGSGNRAFNVAPLCDTQSGGSYVGSIGFTTVTPPGQTCP